MSPELRDKLIALAKDLIGNARTDIDRLPLTTPAIRGMVVWSNGQKSVELGAEKETARIFVRVADGIIDKSLGAFVDADEFIREALILWLSTVSNAA